MDILKKYENHLLHWMKQNYQFIFFNLLFSIIIYFTMFANNLTNDVDGIWHTSNFIAGDWEISLGRGLQRYFDKLRFGIISVPLNSLLTITTVIIGNILILDMLSITNSIKRYLISFLLIAAPTTCISLTYSFTSVNFGLAYLFSIMSVFFIHKKHAWYTLLSSGLCIGISMASYQAYLGCTCTLLLLLLLIKVKELISFKELGKTILFYFCTIAVGGIFYYAITKLLLIRADINLNTYKGASNVSLITIFKNLPASIKNCYVSFFDFFEHHSLYYTHSISYFICIPLIILVLIGIYLVIKEFQTKNWAYSILFILFILLLPIAASPILIIAQGNSNTLLMVMSMYLTLLLLFIPNSQIDKSKLHYIFSRAIICVLSLFLWFSISTITNDQLALKEGKIATQTLITRVMSTLDQQGYFTETVFPPIAFVGLPVENDTFAKNIAYTTANTYARYGAWSTESRNNRYSWLGSLSEYCGIAYNPCDVNAYNTLLQDPLIETMPEYPLEGSIRIINDVIVVKISQLY